MAMAARASVTVVGVMAAHTSAGAATAMAVGMAAATVADMAMVTGTGAAGASSRFPRGSPILQSPPGSPWRVF